MGWSAPLGRLYHLRCCRIEIAYKFIIIYNIHRFDTCISSLYFLANWQCRGPRLYPYTNTTKTNRPTVDEQGDCQFN